MPIPTVNTFTPFTEWRPRLSAMPELPAVVVAASTTINFLDLLKYDGSFNLVQAIAAPSPGSVTLSGGSTSIVGYAMADIVTDATGYSAGLSNQIQIATPEMIQIALRVHGSSAGASQPQDISPGTAYQYGRATTADGFSFYFLSVTSTNGEMTYDELVLGTDPADEYGAIWAHWTGGLLF